MMELCLMAALLQSFYFGFGHYQIPQLTQASTQQILAPYQRTKRWIAYPSPGPKN